MPSEEATRHKNEGASAYSKGEFAAAVTQFSAAIEKTANLSSAEDKEFIKLLHSNRSAAYQNLKQYEKALEDGSRCIELDSQWPKGYGRKGDALLALRRYGDAYNAYNAGLRITPADQALAQKAEQAMAGIRNEAHQSYTQTNNTSSGSPYVHYLHLAIIGAFVVYCVPFIPWSAIFGRISAGSFAGEQILGLLTRHGRPRFENDYAVRVLPDPAMPYLLLGVFVALSPKVYFMSLVPIALLTVIHFLSQILQYARAHASGVIPRMLPLVQRFSPAMVPMVQNLQVDALFSDRNIPQLQLMLRKVAAQAQVSQGVFLIVELLLPTRNFIQLYLWWQFLKLQYMQEQSQPRSSPNNRLIQEAFKSYDQQLTGVLSYRMVPQIVRTGYGHVKTYLAKQVEPPRTGAAADGNASASSGGLTGMFSRCNIM